MSAAVRRSSEEQALLNPAFCSMLIWAAAKGHAAEGGNPLAFGTTFLILPLVLPRTTRERLPAAINSSLATWVSNNPLILARIPTLARSLTPFAKEALLYGGTYGLLRISADALEANQDWAKRITATLSETSDEVRTCAKKAEFVGRWFARAGSPGTVFTLLGVRP